LVTLSTQHKWGLADRVLAENAEWFLLCNCHWRRLQFGYSNWNDNWHLGKCVVCKSLLQWNPLNGIPVNRFIRLMGSDCLGPKVIQLSGAHCTLYFNFLFLCHFLGIQVSTSSRFQTDSRESVLTWRRYRQQCQDSRLET
jgi:hypothetical protein